jgi:Sel1 repeat
VARARGTGAALATFVLALGLHCAARHSPPPANSATTPGCSEATPLRCEAGCFAGDGVACFIFGQATGGVADAPVRLPQDLPRGQRALEKGCQLGNLDACRELVSYETGVAAPGADCAGWEAICKRGNQRSCTFFAQCLDHSDHFRRDRPQALRLFEEGCARGERVACRELGFLALDGDGVPRDEARGFAFLDRACRLDDPLACAHEGLLFELGKGTSRDIGRAEALYRGACARGIRPIPCQGLRRLGEVPPRADVSSADATESLHSSDALGYELRLPANWQFVPAEGIPFSDAPTATEMIAARPRGPGPDLETMLFAVTDFVAIVPGQYPNVRQSSAEMEAQATRWLASHGLAKVAVSHRRFFQLDAVQIEAVTDQPGAKFLTLLLFRKDRRQFELRCLSTERPPDIPCAGALGSLEIHEAAAPPAEVGRVLHLRESGLGLSFDAPDDSWLAFGPRLGMGGRQRVWVYVNAGNQIDIGVLELGRQGEPGLASFIAAQMAQQFRGQGAHVTADQSTLDGQPCVHLLIEGPLTDGTPATQDLFLQVRGGFTYSLLVTSTASRNPDLIGRARRGLHITPLP